MRNTSVRCLLAGLVLVGPVGSAVGQTKWDMPTGHRPFGPDSIPFLATGCR